MWFDNEEDFNTDMLSVLESLSQNGQKMSYFYYRLLSDDFLTNFDNLSYILPDRPKHKYLIKQEGEYLYYSTHGETDKDNKDFGYRVNKYGFRTNKFNKLSKDNINIITAGCSVTFGMALPEEKIWPTILKNRIKNKNIHLDNIGIPGIDSIQEIRNIYIYNEKYGKPDYIFLCLPPIYRFPDLEKQSNALSTKQEIGWIPTKDALEDYIYRNFRKYSIHIFHSIATMKNFEQYCYDTGIKLYWFSWDHSTNEYYRMFGFRNMINYDFKTHDYGQSDEKYWDFARDDSHLGIKYHYVFAEKFYEEFIKNEI